MSKYDDRVNRLASKIGMSQTPVPGLIVGLSGTDSVVAFVMCYDALERTGRGDRLLGVHYVSKFPTNSWFATGMVQWLFQRCPKATVAVHIPLGGNQDQQRWADLHLRALNRIEPNGKIIALEAEDTYWVVGTINATEKELGLYSLLATAVSVQPIITLYKSAIIEICHELGVPDIAIEYSRLPDCLCGRDELAADNIELIDAILTNTIDPTQHDPVLLNRLFQYVRESKADYGFKTRIPYVI